jgi:hypothetical protein
MKLAQCHPTRKMKAHDLCASCYEAWLKEKNPEYKKRQTANSVSWIKIRPEKKKAYVENRKNKLAQNPEALADVKRRSKNSALKKNYGITIEHFEKMKSAQNNKCAICKRIEGKIALHVDHCHTSKKVRGLLCHQCNWYLGTIEADADILPRLIQYLRDHDSPIFKGITNVKMGR